MRTAFFTSLIPHKITPLQFVSTFAFLIILRLFSDFSANHTSEITPHFLLFEILHTGLFFFLTFIFITTFFHFIARISLMRSVGIMLWGFLLTLLPPQIDYIFSKHLFDGQEFVSYYLFDSYNGLIQRYFTFFGDMPHDGITYGTRIVIFCATALITIITYKTTKDPLNTVLAALGAYTIFFLLSSLPSLLTFAITAFSQDATEFYTVAKYFFSPTPILGNEIDGFRSALNIKMSFVYVAMTLMTLAIFAYVFKKHTFIAFLKNIRPLQVCYHIGLLFIGIGVAFLFSQPIISPSFFSIIAFFLLIFSIISAWISAVAFNDIADIKIDEISNPHRPLPQGTITQKEMTLIGIFFFCVSLIITLIITPFASLFILVYHALSWLYNMPPYRIKRIPLLASLLSATASLMIVFVGYIIITPSHNLLYFPVSIALLLLTTFTLSLPIKDFKDLIGDKKDDVWTIPVLFGESIARIIIGVGIFLSYVSSAFFLHSSRLFIPALLFGSLCFWILTYKKSDTFIVSPRAIVPYIFVATFFYGCILAWLVFF